MKNLAIVMTALVLMLWLIISMRYFEIASHNNASIYIFLKMTFYAMCDGLNIIFVIAALTTCIVTMLGLYTDKEIVSFKALGYSELAIVKPLKKFSILICALILVNANFITPVAKYHFLVLREEVKNKYLKVALQSGVFTSGQFHKRMIYINEKIDETHVSGVFIYDKSHQDKIITLTAKRGIISESEVGPTFILFSGTHQEENIKNGQISISTFESFKIDIAAQKREDFVGMYEYLVLDLIDLFAMLIINQEPNSAKIIALLCQRLAWIFVLPFLMPLCVAPIIKATYTRRQLIHLPIYCSFIALFGVMIVIIINNLIAYNLLSIAVLLLYFIIAFMLSLRSFA